VRVGVDDRVRGLTDERRELLLLLGSDREGGGSAEDLKQGG
jgi:hypothetical protein